MQRLPSVSNEYTPWYYPIQSHEGAWFRTCNGTVLNVRTIFGEFILGVFNRPQNLGSTMYYLLHLQVGGLAVGFIPNGFQTTEDIPF